MHLGRKTGDEGQKPREKIAKAKKMRGSHRTWRRKPNDISYRIQVKKNESDQHKIEQQAGFDEFLTIATNPKDINPQLFEYFPFSQQFYQRMVFPESP